MRAWQFSSTAGGLDKNLTLNEGVPIPKPKPGQHIVSVLAVALNPADFKVVEVRLIHRLAISKPATPGYDFVGRIVQPAAGSNLKEGQLLFGAAGSFVVGGALAEYAAVPADRAVLVPEGLEVADAASITMAGITAYQTILPFMKKESRVFINGGSGGTGSWGIQLAKKYGAHVTVSCSSANAEYCTSLGADEVLDYRASPLLGQLQSAAKNRPFDHVVDFVGSNHDLYWKMHTYTTPSARYAYVAFGPSSLGFLFKAMLLPGFLGGGKRKFDVLPAKENNEQIAEIAQDVVDGRFQSVVNKKFKFEEVVEGYRLVKSGRARGKVVIEVGEKL